MSSWRNWRSFCFSNGIHKCLEVYHDPPIYTELFKYYYLGAMLFCCVKQSAKRWCSNSTSWCTSLFIWFYWPTLSEKRCFVNVGPCESSIGLIFILYLLLFIHNKIIFRVLDPMYISSVHSQWVVIDIVMKLFYCQEKKICFW